MNNASQVIAKNLYFDMPARRHESLNIHIAIAKSRACFRLTMLVRLLHGFETANNTHTTTPSSSHGFNYDRGVRGSRTQKIFNLVKACRPYGTSPHRHSTLAGHLTGTNLVAKQFE